MSKPAASVTRPTGSAHRTAAGLDISLYLEHEVKLRRKAPLRNNSAVYSDKGPGARQTIAVCLPFHAIRLAA